MRICSILYINKSEKFTVIRISKAGFVDALEI